MSEKITPMFESVFVSLETYWSQYSHIMGCDDRPFETSIAWSQCFEPGELFSGWVSFLNKY